MSHAYRTFRTTRRGGGKAGIPLHADDSESSVVGILEYLARNSQSPATVVGNREFIDLVREALERLDPTDRRMIELRILGGRTYESIAPELGVTVEAARQRSFRAIRRLRELLPLSSL